MRGCIALQEGRLDELGSLETAEHLTFQITALPAIPP